MFGIETETVYQYCWFHLLQGEYQIGTKSMNFIEYLY